MAQMLLKGVTNLDVLEHESSENPNITHQVDSMALPTSMINRMQERSRNGQKKTTDEQIIYQDKDEESKNGGMMVTDM